jgi:hypothetical protein
VLAAIPLLAVRILWSILAAFADNSTFSIQGGKPLVQLFMAILEQFGSLSCTHLLVSRYRMERRPWILQLIVVAISQDGLWRDKFEHISSFLTAGALSGKAM